MKSGKSTGTTVPPVVAMAPAVAVAERMISALIDCPYEGPIMAQTCLVCQNCGTHVYGPQKRDHLVGDRVIVLGNHEARDSKGYRCILAHMQVCVLARINEDGTYTVEGPAQGFAGQSFTDHWYHGVATINPNQTRAARPGGVGEPIPAYDPKAALPINQEYFLRGTTV